MARRFYYNVDGEKYGPVTGQQLLYLRAEGRISNDTWVRAEDSQTWRPFVNVNLRAERKKASSRSLLFRMLQGASPRVWICLAVLLFCILLFLYILLKYAWPLLFFLALMITIVKSVKSSR